MAESTEMDRERAARLWHDLDDAGGSLIPAVAQALADERERARAPFLRLADDYDRMCGETWMRQRAAISYDFDIIAMKIRRAAEETGQ